MEYTGSINQVYRDKSMDNIVSYVAVITLNDFNKFYVAIPDFHYNFTETALEDAINRSRTDLQYIVNNYIKQGTPLPKPTPMNDINGILAVDMIYVSVNVTVDTEGL